MSTKRKKNNYAKHLVLDDGKSFGGNEVGANGHIKLSLHPILGLPTVPNSVPILAVHFVGWIGPNNCLHRLGVIKLPQSQWQSKETPSLALPCLEWTRESSSLFSSFL